MKKKVQKKPRSALVLTMLQTTKPGPMKDPRRRRAKNPKRSWQTEAEIAEPTK